MSLNDSDVSVIKESENINYIENVNTNEINHENIVSEAEAVKEVKIKRVCNPQPKLDAERLKGPRGIHVIEEIFKNVKFRGRGHEEKDLNILMKTYEYWCHRLFPKLPFDDCLVKIENLGYKKPVQVHIKKMRMNMLTEDHVVDDSEVNDNLLNEQEPNTNDEEIDNFDEILPVSSRSSIITTELTKEQLERIRINKERAQQLKQQASIRKTQIVGVLNDIANTSPSPNPSSINEINRETVIDRTTIQDSCMTWSDMDQNEITS